jgi:transcription elongation factor Elf1
MARTMGAEKSIGRSAMANSPFPGYWVCIRCGLPVLHSTVVIAVDDFGCHFMCTGCGRRNKLRALPGTDEELSAFIQVVDEPKR